MNDIIPAELDAPWTHPATGERRRYINNTEAIVTAAARGAQQTGRLSNEQHRSLRLMVMQGKPYVTDRGTVRGGTITTDGIRNFGPADFREAIKAAAAAALESEGNR